MSDTIYDSLCQSLATFLAKKFEEMIVSKRYTLWGGLQIDADVRMLTLHFSTLCPRMVRDKFTRINQICCILQMEKLVEVEHYLLEIDPEVWKWKKDEIKKILEQRVDFSSDKIKQLRI